MKLALIPDDVLAIVREKRGFGKGWDTIAREVGYTEYSIRAALDPNWLARQRVRDSVALIRREGEAESSARRTFPGQRYPKMPPPAEKHRLLHEFAAGRLTREELMRGLTIW